MGELTITTWNVNSIRARLDHVSEYLAEHEPDIVCLQETKVEDALFPKVPFLELGYEVTIHGGRALCGWRVCQRAGQSMVLLEPPAPGAACSRCFLPVA